MRLLIFGDSITYGAWDIEGGWAARLRKFLDGKTLTDLFNSFEFGGYFNI
jgi:lysophospholipase L1-like esterase